MKIVGLFIVWIVVLAVMLSSCASYDTTYRNSAGQEYQCHGSGFGIGGTMATLANEKNCAANAAKLGYK